MSVNLNYRENISEEILGKTGDYSAYFALYDDLFELGAGGHVIQMQRPCETWVPITHAIILTAAQLLKQNGSLTQEQFKTKLAGELRGAYSPAQMDFVTNIAVQTVFMIDSNINFIGPNYIIGKYHRPNWRPSETLAEFISRCFPISSTEQQEQIRRALEDKAEFAASRLTQRFKIEFKGTQRLTDHLLLDPKERIVYFFHHAEYIRAQLGLWNNDPRSKAATIDQALLERYGIILSTARRCNNEKSWRCNV